MKKIIIIFLSIILFLSISIVFVINKGNSYESKMIKSISNNYKTDSNINYVNKYDDYYIFKTDDYLVILDKNYAEVLKEKLSNLYDLNGKYDIIYKKTKPLYEISQISDDKINYIYYDIYTGEKISSIVLGG